jgi:hypothetical protein
MGLISCAASPTRTTRPATILHATEDRGLKALSMVFVAGSGRTPVRW